MSAPAKLVSVNVGMPKDVPWQGRTVHTGIWKSAVSGPRVVRRLNIEGDGQGDRAGHGGEQRAVFVYQLDSYRHWQDHFGRDDFSYGEFGENFTVDGLGDDEVCIGDRYRIGSAEFEVTQPRVTCFRVGMRVGEPELPALLVAHHRPGFYLRVLTEGEVQAGDDIVRTARGPHELTVAAVDALLYLPDRDETQLRAALEIPALSPGWQGSFRSLLDAATAAPVRAEPGWPGFRELTVTRVVPESADVVSVYLAAADGRALPRPAAGQFLTLRLPGDPAPVRSYSLSGDPAAGGYRISVKLEPHGRVSSYVHASLMPGANVQVAAPRGDFVLAEDDAPVLLVSAGIGVTPVLAMLHDLAARRSERAVWWIHVARNATQHPFVAEARELVDALPNGTARIFYTAPGTESVPVGITVGRPGAATFAALGVPVDAEAYVCGPAAFMTAVHDALVDAGLAPDRLHTELFGALPAGQSGRRRRAARGAAPAARFTRHRPGHHLRAVRADRRAGPRRTGRCSNWPRPATYPPGGRAAPGCATPARRPSCQAIRRTRRHRSSCPQRATR